LELSSLIYFLNVSTEKLLNEMSRSAIVIGAGIVGLATARALAVREYKVTVIDRSGKAVGASIRNFGMIWPIGQPDGMMYDRAMTARGIWKQVIADTGLWHKEAGSLHLAYREDEWTVLQELAETFSHRGYKLMQRGEVLRVSRAAVPKDLIGGLFSSHEMIVDPREVISTIPQWLEEKFDVQFIWGKAVTDIAYPAIYAGEEEFEADEIFVCSGADFETLYPSHFNSQPITKCKLQMLRTSTQPNDWQLGPALCGGLSLLHYKSFLAAPSLDTLRARLQNDYPDHIAHGIHVMLCQNGLGELTIGDSHTYGLTPDPFDEAAINKMILDYLQSFAQFPDTTINQTWNGVYAKLTNCDTELVLSPESGVTIINGLGGAGMTLSFGLTEEVITKKYLPQVLKQV
jgi:FAD dependent oxidoreductase TIGR03364